MDSESFSQSDKAGSSPLKIIITIVIIFVAGIWLVGKIQDAARPKSWTLFLYSSENPDMNYLLNRVDNLSSKDVCISTGYAYSKKFGSYECAYDCRYKKEYFTEICGKTCDHGGCRE